jgi:hypothetical protein
LNRRQAIKKRDRLQPLEESLSPPLLRLSLESLSLFLFPHPLSFSFFSATAL